MNGLDFVRERLALQGKTLFLVSLGFYLFLIASMVLVGGAPFLGLVMSPVMLGHLAASSTMGLLWALTSRALAPARARWRSHYMRRASRNSAVAREQVAREIIDLSQPSRGSQVRDSKHYPRQRETGGAPSASCSYDPLAHSALAAGVACFAA